jgi:hypothetical protein
MGIFDSVTKTIAFLVVIICAYATYMSWGEAQSIAWLVATVGWIPHAFRD